MEFPIFQHMGYNIPYLATYRISGIFRVGLIFAEFATSLKSPNLDTAKNKPCYTSSMRVFEIAKLGLSENLTHLPSVIFANISRREKFPIYGMGHLSLDLYCPCMWFHTLPHMGHVSLDLYCPCSRSTMKESFRFLYTSHASSATT